jgi:MoaA/NifB/PqqE/SkfB family radical SAM enzyme
MYAAKLNYLGLANFQGWKCHAGSVRICIFPDGSVYGAECENDHLGNLDDDSFNILNSPTICKQKECNNNPDDAMTKKYFIDLKKA